MRPAVTITSSRHPAAVGVFLAAVLAGCWGVFVPDGQSSAVDSVVPGWFSTGYYAGLALSGVFGLVALSLREQDVRLRAERCAWYGVGWSGLFYGAAAIDRVGASAGQAAVSAGIWALIATWRILQITHERRRRGADVWADLPTHPPPIGRHHEEN